MTSNDHQLPSIDLDQLLHPDEQQQFHRLCLPTSAEELTELGGLVRLHVEHVRSEGSERTDLDMADRIVAAFAGLLTTTDGFDEEERSLIRGAAEYFLLADDADGDLDAFLGFDDDARIVNSVLARVGRHDLAIAFE